MRASRNNRHDMRHGVVLALMAIHTGACVPCSAGQVRDPNSLECRMVQLPPEPTPEPAAMPASEEPSVLDENEPANPQLRSEPLDERTAKQQAFDQFKRWFPKGYCSFGGTPCRLANCASSMRDGMASENCAVLNKGAVVGAVSTWSDTKRVDPYCVGHAFVGDAGIVPYATEAARFLEWITGAQEGHLVSAVQFFVSSLIDCREEHSRLRVYENVVFAPSGRSRLKLICGPFKDGVWRALLQVAPPPDAEPPRKRASWPARILFKTREQLRRESAKQREPSNCNHNGICMYDGSGRPLTWPLGKKRKGRPHPWPKDFVPR